MPITRKFRTTILDRAASDAVFRRQMLTEAVNELLAGYLEAGKAMLRDYINATITFQQLAKKLKKSDKRFIACSDCGAIPGRKIFWRSSRSFRHMNGCGFAWKRTRLRRKECQTPRPSGVRREQQAGRLKWKTKTGRLLRI